MPLLRLHRIIRWISARTITMRRRTRTKRGRGLRRGGGGVPFVLEFRDLTYSVHAGGRWSRLLRRAAEGYGHHRRLLESVSGEAREGQVLAIMGASGSGKSTLIDALANRIPRRRLGGAVTLNGERVGGRLLRSLSAYVMQDDLLFPMLTVEKTLVFAAEFRLPHSLPRPQKLARVRALIDQLGLGPAGSTIIGDESRRGVSGGERRRVSIGAEIVHDPALLFLDEPTSGLDSASALMVARVLRRIARAGSVVVASVHQPSRRVLALVDRLLILSRGRAASPTSSPPPAAPSQPARAPPSSPSTPSAPSTTPAPRPRSGEYCLARGAQIFEGSPLGELPAELRGRVLAAVGRALGLAISDDACLTTGADVLRQQAVTQLGKWQALAVTVAWGFFFRILFYVALLLGSKNRRR